MIYRIHEKPDADRLATLKEFVESFGYKLERRSAVTPKDLQNLLAQVHGKPEESLISTVLLRSMKRARYSEQNLGHFGLAARYYTHFTSPIRRYPDLVAHRLSLLAFVDKEPLTENATAQGLPRDRKNFE